jgi:predicted Zn-dependent protease
MTPIKNLLTALIAVSAVALYPGAAHAEKSADLDCKLKFSLSTWSVIYKHSEGAGVVTCENGRSMRVSIVAKGVGLTVGKSHVDGGTGRFSDVHELTDVFGSYAQAEAHAGVVKSGTAQVLTKGEVSLALAGAGEGVDLGVDIGELTLTRAK